MPRTTKTVPDLPTSSLLMPGPRRERVALRGRNPLGDPDAEANGRRKMCRGGVLWRRHTVEVLLETPAWAATAPGCRRVGPTRRTNGFWICYHIEVCTTCGLRVGRLGRRCPVLVEQDR